MRGLSGERAGHPRPQAWPRAGGYLFEDLDFEYLFDADMDGVEDDPLAHKTSNIDVRPLAAWFTPFNTRSRVHPYARDLNEPDQPTCTTSPVPLSTATFTRAVVLTQMPQTVNGLDPVNELVAAARRHARTNRTG